MGVGLYLLHEYVGQILCMRILESYNALAVVVQ